MSEVHLFPFEYIDKESKVILYGAGNVSMEYIEQITMSNWCDIVLIVDKKYEEYRNTEIQVCSPEELRAIYNYDYILISIESEKVIEEVKEYLLQMGICEDKIVSAKDRSLGKTYNKISYEKEEELLKDGNIRIAFYPIGGFGDYIVTSKLLQELISLSPNCEIDIFCNPNLGKPIFSFYDNVKELINVKDGNYDTTKYDMELHVEHVIHVKKFNYHKVNRLCHGLAQKVKQLMEEFSKYYVNIPKQQYRDAIFVKKAIYQNLNRYTALNHNGIFEITDKKVQIGLDPTFLTEFNKLGLNKYITINRGAANIFNDNRTQTKVWPKEYYETFLRIIKETYTDIQVVQVGDKASEMIQGVDKFFLGESLELIKYILQNSLLHLDCEGGLVHLATQLGTKCAVIFGPTPVAYYGYDENINIVSDKCNGCMGLTYDWYVACVKGLEKPECMYSIKPQKVFSEVERYLEEKLME